ncbi:hypothetical protein T492DRAFT_831712 [Pavlovales sp. CCMP2436]|nr:hypothetical protein T492DRAFT_831712 [Pavlovales sp. CCMP2436]
MRAHAANATVQEQACRALAIIAFLNDARRQAASDAGALPQIVAAMSAHAANASVQKQACGAIFNIIYGNDAQGANAGVQEKACWALCHITGGIDAQRLARAQAAADTGPLPQIVAAMRARAANAVVQEMAALRTFTLRNGAPFSS